MIGGRKANMVMSKGIHLVSVAEAVYQSHLVCRGLGRRKKKQSISRGCLSIGFGKYVSGLAREVML